MADEPNLDRIVFTAESAAVAEAVIRLLTANDIPAELATGGPKTASDPLTGASALTETDEFPVAVADPAKVKDALELLATAQTAALVQSVRQRRAARTGAVTATCEECGKESQWPAVAMGTTETCPHCGAYMDIPDPDDDWSGVDFGAPDEESETQDGK